MRHEILLTAVVACQVFVFQNSAISEPSGKKALMGEINIEQSEPQKRNGYADTQDASISYFHKLADIVVQLSQGAVPGPIPSLSDDQLNFLNAVYLHCASNLGTCPMVLDGVLEIDLINSRLAKQAECPNMTRFWKLWVRSDMESRQKYLVKTGFLRESSDFNDNQRMAYIKCQDTLTSQISSKAADAAFFKERYAADSAHNLVAVKIVKLLEEIKTNVSNIFAAIGISAISESKGSAAGKSMKR